MVGEMMLISWLKAFAAGWWWSDPKWWGATVNRVLRSAAQGLVFAILADQAGWFHHWYQIATTAGTLALLAFLTSILMPTDTVTH
jgi:hypothetical protein